MAKKLKTAIQTKPNSSGETASELSHRHLKDESHQTTDEEIRNIALDLDPSEGISDTKSKEKDKKATEEDDIIITPLSVLGE